MNRVRVVFCQMQKLSLRFSTANTALAVAGQSGCRSESKTSQVSQAPISVSDLIYLTVSDSEQVEIHVRQVEIHVSQDELISYLSLLQMYHQGGQIGVDACGGPQHAALDTDCMQRCTDQQTHPAVLSVQAQRRCCTLMSRSLSTPISYSYNISSHHLTDPARVERAAKQALSNHKPPWQLHVGLQHDLFT